MYSEILKLQFLFHQSKQDLSCKSNGLNFHGPKQKVKYEMLSDLCYMPVSMDGISVDDVFFLFLNLYSYIYLVFNKIKKKGSRPI